MLGLSRCQKHQQHHAYFGPQLSMLCSVAFSTLWHFLWCGFLLDK